MHSYHCHRKMECTCLIFQRPFCADICTNEFYCSLQALVINVKNTTTTKNGWRMRKQKKMVRKVKFYLLHAGNSRMNVRISWSLLIRTCNLHVWQWTLAHFITIISSKQWNLHFSKVEQTSKEKRAKRRKKMMENDSSSVLKCYFLPVNLDGIFTIRCIPVRSSTTVQITKNTSVHRNPLILIEWWKRYHCCEINAFARMVFEIDRWCDFDSVDLK